MKTSWKVLGCLTAVVAVGALAIHLGRSKAPLSRSGSHSLPMGSVVSSHRSSADPRWNSLADPAVPLRDRLETAASINGTLPAADVALLFSLMDHRPPVPDKENWWVVLNEIMRQMRLNGDGAGEYSGKLSRIIADASAPEVARDYAIQHLAQWLAPAVEGTPAETEPTQRGMALSAIAAAIKDPSLLNSSIPGSGLLALAEISPRLPEADRSAVWSGLDGFMTAVIAGKTEASVSLQTSAIGAAGMIGDARHLPVIRGYVSGPDVNSSIRLSSIAALGVFGTREDEALLKSYFQPGNRFQYAARAALERLQQASRQ